jgi:glycosyltransferase involved in cell wall biosynthesis
VQCVHDLSIVSDDFLNTSKQPFVGIYPERTMETLPFVPGNAPSRQVVEGRKCSDARREPLTVDGEQHKMETKSRNKRVLLLHGDLVPHYRIPIYNYFWSRFKDTGVDFSVAGPTAQSGSTVSTQFSFRETQTSLAAWLKVVYVARPDAVIVFSALRHLFILPFAWILRIVGIRVIYWGHGINLSDKEAHRVLYGLLHRSCHGIILYSEHLKQYVHRQHHKKVFVANNTLCLGVVALPSTTDERMTVLKRHGIKTTANVVFVGRIQKRKRISDLVEAAKMIEREDVGVILVGPDVEHVLPEELPPAVTHIPSLYGRELLSLLMACDVYCCPGSVGLNIVDAMACGLPFVTEDIDTHGPEITYFKDGENGVLIPKGRADCLANALLAILSDNTRRRRMAECAKSTFEKEASIERMYQGFAECVRYVLPFTS